MKTLLALLLLLASIPTHAASITDPAKITNGDTIEILGMTIRLEGIYAPETGQTYKKPVVPLHRADKNEELNRHK